MINIVAKAPAPQSQPILAVALPDAGQLPDRMDRRAIVGIAREDCDRLLQELSELGMVFGVRPGEAIET